MSNKNEVLDLGKTQKISLHDQGFLISLAKLKDPDVSKSEKHLNMRTLIINSKTRIDDFEDPNHFLPFVGEFLIQRLSQYLLTCGNGSKPPELAKALYLDGKNENILRGLLQFLTQYFFIGFDHRKSGREALQFNDQLKESYGSFNLVQDFYNAGSEEACESSNIRRESLVNAINSIMGINIDTADHYYKAYKLDEIINRPIIPPSTKNPVKHKPYVAFLASQNNNNRGS